MGQTYEQTLDFGTAVCGGYSALYEFLLDGVNIECKYHANFFHAWNYVKIDGKWYGVDVTCMDQDDSIPDCGEDVRYDMACFLTPDKYTFGYYSPEDKPIANDYRFFKTIYEELTTYNIKHPDEAGPAAIDYWDKNGNFHGKIADYSGFDYHCNPWFTGTWVNY